MRRVRVEGKRRQDLLVGRARRVEAALEVFDAQHRRLDLVGERRARPVVAQLCASAGRDAAEPRREVFRHVPIEQSERLYDVQRIVSHRHRDDGGRQYLLRWKGWTSKHDSWEDEARPESQTM